MTCLVLLRERHVACFPGAHPEAYIPNCIPPLACHSPPCLVPIDAGRYAGTLQRRSSVLPHHHLRATTAGLLCSAVHPVPDLSYSGCSCTIPVLRDGNTVRLSKPIPYPSPGTEKA